MTAPASQHSSEISENLSHPGMDETALVQSESRPQQGESVAQTLRRSLLKLNARRGAAYGRLNQEIRSTAKPGTSRNQFQIVCANVTEELKLVSEGVIALRNALAEQNLPHSETAVQWIDALQNLEERKLVAFVSLRALHRSRDAGRLPTGIDGTSTGETTEMKISRYAKQLNDIDTDISDLLEEIKEFIAEEE